MGVLLYISASNSTLLACKSVFPPIKSNVPSKPSTHYCHPRQSHFRCSNQHSVSSPIAAKSSPLAGPFFAISSLRHVTARLNSTSLVSSSIIIHGAISDGGCSFSRHGHPFH